MMLANKKNLYNNLKSHLLVITLVVKLDAPTAHARIGMSHM